MYVRSVADQHHSLCSNDRVERPPMKCYNCGNEGHAQRDCPEERAGGAYGGDKKCYVSYAPNANQQCDPDHTFSRSSTELW